MDRSPAASQISDRCIAIASSLEDAAKEVAEAASWTNFDLTVVTLAQCYGVVRFSPHAYAGNQQSVKAFSQFGDRILKLRLGPVLARKVSRESFAKVVANYEARYGKDGVSLGLQALQQASLEAERTAGFRLSEQSLGLLIRLGGEGWLHPGRARREVQPSNIIKWWRRGGGGRGTAAAASRTKGQEDGASDRRGHCRPS